MSTIPVVRTDDLIKKHEDVGMNMGNALRSILHRFVAYLAVALAAGGLVCARATSDITGIAAAPAAGCKNLRGEVSQRPPETAGYAKGCRLDNWPPFLGLGLVESIKRFRGPLLAWEYLLADIGERLRTVASASASAIAALSFTTISLGVDPGRFIASCH